MKTTEEMMAHFPTWVASQPDDRSYSFWSLSGCIVGLFLQDTMNITYGGGPDLKPVSDFYAVSHAHPRFKMAPRHRTFGRFKEESGWTTAAFEAYL